MSILNELQEKIIHESWDMNPVEDSYMVAYDNVPVCKVDFTNQGTQKSDDLEIAQESPQKYIVYVTEIKDKFKTEEYIEKLKSLGFTKISIHENVSETCEGECEDCTCKEEVVTEENEESKIVALIVQILNDTIKDCDSEQIVDAANIIYDQVVKAQETKENVKIDVQNQYESKTTIA